MKDIEVLSGPMYNIGYTQDMVPKKKRKLKVKAAFERLVEVLSSPFDEKPEFERYTLPPRPEQVVQQTFCGT